jgi:molybdopterin-containing oxidoreductase family iron-sulfur binding subunit
VHPEKQVVSVPLTEKHLNLPVLIIPGTHADTVGIAVGYGRNAELVKLLMALDKMYFHLLV